MSFPHNLVLDSQPHLGLTSSEFLNLHKFLINFSDFYETCFKVFSFRMSVLSSTCKSL